MFDIGGGEFLFIVLAVIVLFGPKKIPEIAQMIGKGIRQFRQAQQDFTQHVRDISLDVEKSTNSTYQIPQEQPSEPEDTPTIETNFNTEQDPQ